MMEFQEFWRKYQFSFWVMVHSWLQLSTIQTDQSTQEKSVISRTREVCRHHWYLMKRARLETLIPCWSICACNLRVSSGRIQSSLISQELYHLKSILILWITYIFFPDFNVQNSFHQSCVPSIIDWCSLFENFDCVLLFMLFPIQASEGWQFL